MDVHHEDHAIPLVSLHSSVESPFAWEPWTGYIYFNPSHRAIIRSLGIENLNAASRYKTLRRDYDSLDFLFPRWTKGLHTFFFSWVEVTLTIEDVVALTGIPFLASIVTIHPVSGSHER